jgi:hypothetical protein
MTTLEVRSHLSFETLLNSLPQLSSEELAQLTEQAAMLEAQRRVGSLPEPEANLLLKINQEVVPSATRQRCTELTSKARAGMINDEEHAELMDLIDKIEKLNAQRLKYLVNLARLRGVTLDALMNSLEISPLSYE